MSTLEVVLALASMLLGLGNTWGLFIIRGLKDDIDTLRTADLTLGERLLRENATLNEKMAIVRELVIGQYVTHTQFDTAMAAQTKQIMDRMDEMFRYLRPPQPGMHGDTRSTDRG